MAPEVLVTDGDYDIRCDLWSIGIIVYFMTHGYPPFHADSEPELFRQILSCEYHFDLEQVKNPLAIDFIKNLLRKNPDHRLSIDEAMKHPWLQVAVG